MTDESDKSARSATSSRREVLTSMFLGADSPAAPAKGDHQGGDGDQGGGGGGVAPPPRDTRAASHREEENDAGAGAGAANQPNQPNQPRRQQSTQLRLVKELRRSKETNVVTLRNVTRLETEVAALRTSSGGFSASRSGGDLQTLVEIAAKDGEAEAIRWATGRLEQQKHSRSSTSLNTIGFASPTGPPGLPFSGMMSPLTTPRELGGGGGGGSGAGGGRTTPYAAVGTMTDGGAGVSGGGGGGNTPGIRRRIQTPHPRRKGPDDGAVGATAGDGRGGDAAGDRGVLVKAAESIPHEFVSDLATYYVRVPYVPTQPEGAATPGSSDPWELHGVVASSRFYADVADANRASTIEVMARIVSDGSVAVLHDACSLRHDTAGGNGSNDFRNVDTMDGPLGCVMYIDVDGTEREYWLGKLNGHICEKEWCRGNSIP